MSYPISRIISALQRSPAPGYTLNNIWFT
jgi:hypothetical protein